MLKERECSVASTHLSNRQHLLEAVVVAALAAEAAGLKGGDLLVQFGSAKIGGLDDFDLALRKYKGGDVVNVTVIRGGKRKAMKITLAKPR